MKIWCETCEGGQLDTSIWKCAECDGKGYTNPPQQLLDDLECAEIERRFRTIYDIHHMRYEFSHIDIGLVVLCGSKIFSGRGYSKLTLLQSFETKIKEFIEGRG